MKTMSGCLMIDEVRQFMNGSLTVARIDEVEDHLAVCDFCVHAVEKAARQDPWWLEVESALRDVIDDPDGTQESDLRSDHDVLALLGPTDDPAMIGRIGIYEIVGILGRGGMGVVFKAFDSGLNRFVAIKLLLPQLAASGAARARFRREGQAAAAVVDDHVLPIYGVDEWRSVPYLVMRYVRGSNLERRLKDQGPLQIREILRIGLHAARGLTAAHAQGLVHRDIKPSNILLEGTVDRAILSDFGLARAVDDASLTRSGVLAGTPLYMSPEQVRGETIDQRSDLFSLGSVLYAMSTGQPPFRARSSYAVMRRITDETQRPVRETSPELPEWLEQLIAWLMAKDPDDRPQTARAVEKVLRQCLSHVERPYAVPLPREFARFRTNAHKPRIRSFAMFSLAVAVLGLVIRTGADSLHRDPVEPASGHRESVAAPVAIAAMRPVEKQAPADPPARTEPAPAVIVRVPVAESKLEPKPEVQVAVIEPKTQPEERPAAEPEPEPLPELKGETVAAGYRIRLVGTGSVASMQPVTRIDPKVHVDQLKSRPSRKADAPANPNRGNRGAAIRQFGPNGQSFSQSFSSGGSFGQSFSSGNSFGQNFSGGEISGMAGQFGDSFSQNFTGGDSFGQTFAGGTAFGNVAFGGGEFGGADAGAFGGVVEKPNFGIAFEITEEKPGTGRNERIVELSPDARIVEADGETVETPPGPMRFSFPEFEARFMGAKAVYLNRAAWADEHFRKLDGKLLITPGRRAEVHFKGTKPQTRKDGSAVFVLESVKQTEGGIQVVVKFPAPASARRGDMMAAMQAILNATAAAELSIVDSEGQVHAPTSKASGHAGSSSFRSTTANGTTTTESSGSPMSSSPRVTFGFPPLPEGVTIESIVASTLDRTGEPKVVPFTLPIDPK